MLLERVVNVDKLLGVAGAVALTAVLLLALEVVLVAAANQLLGTLPLLVLLAAIVGSASFLHSKAFELLSSLLGEIVGVGLGVVLRLGFGLLDLTTIVDGDSLTFFVPGLAGVAIVGGGLLALLVSLSITSLLIGPFAIASLLAPAMSNLLLVITVTVLDSVGMK